ncbi:hypothetical protein DVR12_23900 [Chitinophaga silvatica]|uniref:Uncharacterized protein n=1 Tax=Chitinophaga silvatica TaxID=2282649 RepID=A0A3E1Y3L2_9BACT|nr:hypothetical protein [Chitinophaga silvatica]RFS19281.1 hypothetical protein DVR12_23900 [Chitinophaga silvatica]
MRYILVLLLVFSNQVLKAQSTPAVNEITAKMLTYFKHLNTDVDKGISAEKKAEMSGHLDLLKQDLNGYMTARKKLSDSLFRSNITPGSKNSDELDLLKGKMSQVIQQLRGVNDFVCPGLQTEGDKLNEEIYNVLYEEPVRYLSNLEAFLAGVPVTKKDLALDGSIHYQRLEESIKLLSDIQRKIGKK